MKLTLRLKLILLIGILLLGSVGTYLYFAVNLFVSDKTSYVYDTSLATTSYLAKDVYSTIQNASENAFTFALIGKKKPELIKELLSLKTKILAFKIESRENIPIFIHPRIKELYGIDSASLKKISDEFNINSKKEIEIVNISHSLGIPALNLIIYNQYMGDRYIYTIYAGDLQDSFQKDSTFKNFLIDNDGKVIIGPAELSDEIISIATTSQAESLSQKIKSDENELMSFTRLEDLGLIVISKISEADAFEVTDYLKKRSAAMAMILLGLGVILGLFFSSGITKPIEELVRATRLIATGKYGAQIKIKTKDEVSLLARSFNSMSVEIKNKMDEIQEANEQLDYMNKNLEKLVAQRTAELAEANSYLDAMVNSLGQGLLVLDKEGNCSPFFTKVCVDIFNDSPEGKNYFDLLNIVHPDRRKTLDKWLGSLYKEMIPFESLADLGPKVFETNFKMSSPDFKHISLEYFPMRRKSEAVENVLVVATDKTKQIIAEESFKKEKEESERMMFIQKNRRSFIRFLRETERLIEEIAKLTQESLVKSLDLIKLNLHSIKGSSGIYKLHNIYREVDKTEELLMGMSIETQSKEIAEKLNKLVDFVKGEIESVKDKDKTLLGEEIIDGIPRYVKRLDKMQDFANLLSSIGSNDLLNEFKNKIFRIPASDYFRSTNQFLQDLAEQLNKELKPIRIEGGGTLIDPSKFTPLFDSFVHLYRNIMDHGIELPHIREEKGKDEKGSIKINISKKEDALEISIIDDGAGISAEKVREVMQKRGYPESKLKAPNEKVIYHIFDPDFSTVAVANHISGRGVGMSAIKEEVIRLGGKIKVQTKEGKGTAFYFRVPYA